MDIEQSSRHTLRLSSYDYASEGMYFVTICAYERMKLFGRIVKDKSFLSPLGRIIDKYLLSMQTHYKGLSVDEHVVMPNHIHVIINIGRTRGSAPTLGTIIKRLKSFVIHEYAKGINDYGWEPYKDKIWQRNYYEHIVRDDNDLERIRLYIRNNPANWSKDKLNKFSL